MDTTDKKWQGALTLFCPDSGELLVMGKRSKQLEFDALLGYRVQ